MAEIKTLGVRRPTTPEEASERLATDHGRPRKKAVLLIIGLIVVGLAIATRVGSSSSSSSGNFTPAAGWTIDRVATLGLKIDAYDGRSSGTAACAAKAIAAETTWSEWTALSNAEQLVQMRGAERDC